MADNNNPFKFLEDLGKGASDLVEEAAKTIQGGAGMVVDGVGGAVEVITKAVTGGSQEEGLPKKNDSLKYRDNSEVNFDCRGTEKMNVKEVYLNNDGQECEGPSQEIRLSKAGVELFSENGRKRHFLRTMNVSNVELFKNGKTEGGNPMRNAAMYAAMGAASGDGPFPGAAIGFFCTPRPEDIWFMRIIEHDGTTSVYRLWGKSDGDRLVTFLDTYALA